ncbi:hypothetical protein HMP06_1085 [Sphingomonas sp. HMP6]|nr:hypothetical protein HMP06_1085 [Sphingomonas sp. HMP6]
MRSLSSMTMLAAAGLMIFAGASLAVAPPAHAQGRNNGTVSMPTGGCPSGWFPDSAPRTCKPAAAGSSSTPAIYVRTNTRTECAPGYWVDNQNNAVCTTRKYVKGPSAEAERGTGGRIKKPDGMMRCPTGWRTTEEFTHCYTETKNAPIARPKGAKPCAAGELSDWGTWCISNYENLTYDDARRAGVADFNKTYVFALKNGRDAAAVPDDSISPEAEAFFQSVGRAPAADSASGDASSSGSQPAAAQAAECVTGSEVGVAVGGALGGRTGAALGGALGGLGKKKKKNGC